MEFQTYDFQENNQIITLPITADSNTLKYKFKDSYTIKIHDCKALQLNEDTGDYLFNMSTKDETLESFCEEMLITIGVTDGELDPHLGKCQILCKKKGFVSIENTNLIGTTKLTAFNPLRDSQSFARLAGHSLVLTINLSTFIVKNNTLLIDFTLEKITIIGDLHNTSVVRSTDSVDELIKKNYIAPVDPSCIRTKLLKIYTDSTSITSTVT